MKKNQLLIVSFFSICLLMMNICEAKEKGGKMEGCKNLEKVTDIDNLLYQFYSNLDTVTIP